MPYIVICQKPDGAIEVAGHAGEASPELLQGAVPAQNLDEAMQLAKEAMGGAEGAPAAGAEGQPAPNAGNDAPADEEYGGAEGMPMHSREDQMEAGFRRAKKGY